MERVDAHDVTVFLHAIYALVIVGISQLRVGAVGNGPGWFFSLRCCDLFALRL